MFYFCWCIDFHSYHLYFWFMLISYLRWSWSGPVLDAKMYALTAWVVILLTLAERVSASPWPTNGYAVADIRKKRRGSSGRNAQRSECAPTTSTRADTHIHMEAELQQWAHSSRQVVKSLESFIAVRMTHSYKQLETCTHHSVRIFHAPLFSECVRKHAVPESRPLWYSHWYLTDESC